jgi:hypothetical protein
VIAEIFLGKTHEITSNSRRNNPSGILNRFVGVLNDGSVIKTS